MKKIILLVDDDSLKRRGYKKFFERVGYSVIDYQYGRQVISAIIDGLNYDIAIIDFELNLNDADGEEVIKFSKEINPEVPVIGWTGYEGLKLKGADVSLTLLMVSNKSLIKIIESLLSQ